MVCCAFCKEEIIKGVPSFGFPAKISPAAKEKWLYYARDHLESTNRTEFEKHDRVCASHFASPEVRYNTGKLWRLRENAVPTINVNGPGSASILPPPGSAKTYSVNQTPTPKRQPLTEPNENLLEISPAKVTIKPIRRGQNPFQCNFCPDSFEKESTLNYHINNQHQEEVAAAAKVEILSIENIDNGKMPGSVTQDENANELVDYDTVEEACVKVNGEVAGQVVHEENVVFGVFGEYLDEEEFNETASKVEYEIEDVNFELEVGDGENEPEELSNGGTSDGDVNVRVSEGMLKNEEKLRNLTHAPTIMSRLGKMAHKRKHSK